MPYSYASLVAKKIARYDRRQRCPVCGRPGSGPHVRKIKGHEYKYYAHSHKYSDTGRYYVRWCYAGPARD